MAKFPVDAPDRIYLQHDPEDERGPFSEAYEVTWYSEEINATDIEYVRADLCKRSNQAWGEMNMDRYAGYTAEQVRQFRDERRFPPASADRWTRLCLLLRDAGNNQHHECLEGDTARCLACDLESRIDQILSEEV